MLEKLYGTWKLKTAREYDKFGKHVDDLFSPNPCGLLCYNTDGYVFVHITSGVRSTYSERERETPNKVYYGYSGRFDIEGNKVFHRVQIAREPSIMGETLERDFALDGDVLTLTWDRILEHRGEIVWERIK